MKEVSDIPKPSVRPYVEAEYCIREYANAVDGGELPFRVMTAMLNEGGGHLADKVSGHEGTP